MNPLYCATLCDNQIEKNEECPIFGNNILCPKDSKLNLPDIEDLDFDDMENIEPSDEDNMAEYKPISCPNCGSYDVFKNACGEILCDNCGYEEANEKQEEIEGYLLSN